MDSRYKDKAVSGPSYLYKENLHTQTTGNGLHSVVDKTKFIGRPPDQPWWKTGSPESFLGCSNHFDLFLKKLVFSYQHKIYMFSV